MKQLPIGIQTFENIREEGYLYVDKTALVYKMTHEYKYVFLSRPRRFGKSLLCSTLKSYFEGRKELFEGRVGDIYTLDIPNHEVRIGLMHSLAPYYICEDTDAKRMDY